MPVHCAKCGKSNFSDAKFCVYCGAEIAASQLSESVDRHSADLAPGTPVAKPGPVRIVIPEVHAEPDSAAAHGAPPLPASDPDAPPASPLAAKPVPISMLGGSTGSSQIGKTKIGGLDWQKTEWQEVKIDPAVTQTPIQTIEYPPAEEISAKPAPLETSVPPQSGSTSRTFPASVESAPEQKAISGGTSVAPRAAIPPDRGASSQPHPGAHEAKPGDWREPVSAFDEPRHVYEDTAIPGPGRRSSPAPAAVPLSNGTLFGCGCVTLFIPLIGIIAAIIWLTQRRPRALGFLIFTIAAPALLWAIALPALYFVGTGEQAKDKKEAQEGLRTIQILLEKYSIDHAAYPANISDLIIEGYTAALPRNPYRASDGSGDENEPPEQMIPQPEGYFSAGDFVYTPIPDASGKITDYSLKLYGEFESDGVILELSSLSAYLDPSKVPEAASDAAAASPSDAAAASDSSDTAAAIPSAEDSPAGLPSRLKDKGDRAILETTKGRIVILLHPDWAPVGVGRFKQLVNAGFYDGAPWFRVIDGFIAQCGISADPAMNQNWGFKTIKDDRVIKGNLPGRVAFGKTADPDSRTTHIFINLADNSYLDAQGHAAIGQVVEGLSVARKLSVCEFADQGVLSSEGGIATFKSQYPDADYILKAHLE